MKPSTPLPWKAVQCCKDHPNTLILRDSSNRSVDLDESENALYIEVAANLHERLVDALRWALSRSVEERYCDPIILQHARALLDEADKGA